MEDQEELQIPELKAAITEKDKKMSELNGVIQEQQEKIDNLLDEN